MFPVDQNNQNQTTFSLTVSKQDGEASETTSLSSTNKEDIVNVLNRFDQIDSEHDYYKDDEECGCPAPEEQGIEMENNGFNRMRELAGLPVKEEKIHEMVYRSKEQANREARKNEKEIGGKWAVRKIKHKGRHDRYEVDTYEPYRIDEDADFDYRDDGNKPNDPRNFNYDNDILSFARKGHSKKGNKIVNNYGDNPLPDPAEEEKMFESLMEDWENYKGYEENPQTYISSQLRNYREKDLIDIAHANLGWAVAKQLEDILGVKKSQETLEEQNSNALQKLVQFLRDKDEEDVAMEIEAFLHGDDLGPDRAESIELGETFENKTSINVSGLSGLEINRMVRQLERLGLEQGKTMFIKSEHPSWISNEMFDYDVADILGRFGAEEYEGELDEVSPYLEKPLRSEKEARRDIEKKRASVVGNRQPKGTKDIEGISQSRNKGEKSLGEESPKGFEGTVKAMKKHKDVDSPWALSNWMKKKGYKSHYTKGGKKKKD